MKAYFLAALFGLAGLTTAAVAQDKPVAVASAEDPLFNSPFIDIDEMRDAPVRHRYVHGGFTGTDMRFSFYLPPKEKFQGRFFQYVTPVPDSENLAQTIQNGDDKIGFAISSGGYFIETNGGGKSATAGPAFGADPAIGAYRANAAAARYSRILANAMYGPGRIYGYLYGGSGGGYRTLGSMENTQGVWDGAVPFVLGSPMAAPNGFSIRMHAMRILRDKFPQIVDAVDAGGSGNPYAGLNSEQAAALKEATQMGFPINSWFGHKEMGVHAFTAIYQGMVLADPKYFEEFWTTPGYLGHDAPESLNKARLRFETTIQSAITKDELDARGLSPKRLPGQTKDAGRGTADLAWQALANDGAARPAAFGLATTPPDVGFIGGDLFILSGEAKGKRVALLALSGNVATLGVVDLATIAQIRPGDAVRVDNSNFLAAQTYHRHQVPDASYKVYDQFRDKDGKPLYPQRKFLLGPLFAQGAAGTVPSGKFNGKIIVVESMLDREAYPWQADWYAQRFNANYGAEANNKYRLWFTENALHGYNEFVGVETRVINYLPVLEQALRDLSKWVEKDIPPPATNNYQVVDGQVQLPASAFERKGVQPVITLFANGHALAKVRKNERVAFTAQVDAPPGAGSIVKIEWDFDGSGAFALKKRLDAPVTWNEKQLYRFTKAGTYFVTARATLQRDGDADTPYAAIQNLARVRVVVK